MEERILAQSIIHITKAASSMILRKLSSLNLSFLTCKMGITMHIMLTWIKNKNICNMFDLY